MNTTQYKSDLLDEINSGHLQLSVDEKQCIALISSSGESTTMSVAEQIEKANERNCNNENERLRICGFHI
ncbi:hypothetical protein [Photobacterium galatheae]|uniref:Uncharacterized protein n=1 Tax=Photobacterium galatheae TaxID=1654360 RepID=A0A066RP65_9GAMM|nr:hypothetical protein [Photobacterium galatheae]KDM90916.1 hypothetical protein EA58_14245 [Photobacterium galatheae]MCM0149120.1 hypothetical protein [Photobacterium galatheae]